MDSPAATTVTQRAPSETITASLPRKWFGRLFWLVPALVTGLIVRYQAARPQLWRDEFATWSAAERGDLGNLTRHIDGVFLLYYHLMRVWTQVFGDSAMALRMPSILAASATAGVIALTGGFLGSRSAGVLGGLLFAVVPSTTRYGQEGRPYALACLAATVATLLLFIALRRQRWFWWAGYAVAVAAMGSLHLVTLVLLAGHAVPVLDEAIRSRSWRVLPWAAGAVLAGLAPVLPIALLGQSQLSQQLGNRPVAPDIFMMGDLPYAIFGGSLVGGAVLALAAVGAFGPIRLAGVLGLTVFVPVVTFLTVSQFALIYSPRYLLFAVPLACVLGGLTLARLHWAGALAVVLIVGFGTLREQVGARESHESRGTPLFDHRKAARIIGENEKPGDVIVYRRDGWQFADIATEYYLRDRTPADVLAAQSRDTAGSFWTPETTDPAAALKGHDRVWALVPDNLATRRPDTLPPATQTAVDSGRRQVQRWRVSGITVWLYQRA